MKLAFTIGTVLQVTQKADLATHLLPITLHGTAAICGADTGHYPTYAVKAKVQKGGLLVYEDGSPCLHHVDCKRCLAICAAQKLC